MKLWLNIYCFSMLLFMLSYLFGSDVLAITPTFLILVTIAMTFIWVLRRSRVILAGAMARIYVFALSLLFLFIIKHIVLSGSAGLFLATKIAAYHLVFISGLLIGYYNPPLRAKSGVFYSVALFFLPLIFFILIAQGGPASEVLFVFNRNPFAAYTITTSALLLGLGVNRQLLSLGKYIFLVSFALFLNITLGAIFAFFLAIIIYISPQILSNRRFLFGAFLLFAVSTGGIAYILLNPEAFQDVETVNRMRFVIGLFFNLVSNYPGSWLELDMATAVKYAPPGKLDMSAVFRILHWINIISIRAAEGTGALLLGGGTDWIEENRYRFVYSLAAHNEYIRLVAEQGLVHAIIIFVSLYFAVFSLRRSPLFIPIMAATIYLGSENAFNDFVSTTIYFFALGYAFSNERRRRSRSIGMSDRMSRRASTPVSLRPTDRPATSLGYNQSVVR